MTFITDDGGTRWVEMPQKKRRSTPRALKFADVKVGDQLMMKPRDGWYRGLPFYVLVTDMWFDPVEGQDDPLKGSMVGYAQIKPDGSISRKSSTTVRGLASQQYDYADVDYIALCGAKAEAKAAGEIVSIAFGNTIRARPKISGL